MSASNQRQPGQSPVSHAMEDYLKAIYELSGEDERVSTSRLAEEMNCTPASVTNMLQRLDGLSLVQYTPYKGVTLTATGTKIALEIVRHHRLIELYLSEVLGYSWDQVHAEADQLEHVISEEFEARIDAALGHPERDPHGAPIPRRDGTLYEEPLTPLWLAPEGRSLVVKKVDDRSPEVLRYLGSLGIVPEVMIRLNQRAPFNGPVLISMGGADLALSEELARQIYVAAAPES